MIKLEGDDRCFTEDQFTHVSEPDLCGKQHFHFDKKALDGSTLKDEDSDGCGVGTVDQATRGVIYIDENARDIGLEFEFSDYSED